MPDASRTLNYKSQTINNKPRKLLVSCFRFQVPKEGFTLIEILLSLFFIIAIVTILFSTTGSLFTRRQSDLQSIAAKIATKEIEKLRGDGYSFLPADDINCIPYPTFNDPDLQKLRSGCVIRRITNYQTANDPIKQISLTVRWNNDNNVQQSISMDTLIYEKGL